MKTASGKDIYRGAAAAVGALYGFPMPETVMGWSVPVSVLIFASFAILRSES